LKGDDVIGRVCARYAKGHFVEASFSVFGYIFELSPREEALEVSWRRDGSLSYPPAIHAEYAD
jgi:hypothetical protein